MATAENIPALAAAALNADQKMVNSMCRVIAANERDSSTLKTRPDDESCKHRQPDPLELGEGKYGCPYCKEELNHMGGLLHEYLNDECAEKDRNSRDSCRCVDIKYARQIAGLH